MLRQKSLAEIWSPDDLREITDRIEFAKEQSGCSLMSIMEIIEILELLQGITPNSPLPQQRYFQKTADELIGLAISYLEKLRTGLQFVWQEESLQLSLRAEGPA